MKKIASILGLGAVVALGLGSCSNEDILPTGEGRVLLTAKVNSDVKVASRADLTATQEELAAECRVWISNSKGLVRRFEGLDNIPAGGITLLSDHYIAEAWTGDSVSAAWDKRWFKGRQEFDITAGALTRVDLVCKIANTLVTVKYDDSANDVLTDYTLTVSHSRGALTFEGQDERTGYFMMPQADKDLTWKLQGTLKSDGSLYTKEGTIADVKQAYKYNMTISCTPKSEDFGGVYFDVKVDPTEVEVNQTVEIVVAPQFEGYGFDLSEPVLGEEGTLPRRSVFVKSGTTLKNVVLESEDFPTLLGINDIDVDLLTMTSGVAEQVKNGGISFAYTEAEDGTSMIKVSFEKEYANRLENGIHSIKITATDSQDKSSTATLTYNVSDAAVIADEVLTADVWTTTATLRGTVSKEGVESVNFQYRKQGESSWTTVAAVAENGSRAEAFAKGTRVMAELSGLSAGTNYEWLMTGDEFKTDVKSFTTGVATQLPNASFENWQGTTPLLIYGAGEEMFWDSGNHGSATMKKNVTVSTSSMVHSGALAASLNSQFVGLFAGAGKFAAGNVFVGRYLDTDGTDGVLGWGRPFTGRPKQVKVWAHYTPVAIDNLASGAPAEYKKGDLDRGIIYAALMDDHTVSYTAAKNPPTGISKGDTFNFPVIVKTKSKELFDKDGEHVIAYGEHIFEGATPGSQLVEVTFDLDYHKLDVIPSYIVLTASASKGGDYFSGGSGSKLIIDDIELIY